MEIRVAQLDADAPRGVAAALQVFADTQAERGERSREFAAVEARVQVALEGRLAYRLGFGVGDERPLVAAVRRVVQPASGRRAGGSSSASGAAASSPTVLMPSSASAAGAFGPMPLILRAANGHMRRATSCASRTVIPSGLSRSEQILASGLLGAMPIEHDRPVACCTPHLMRRASAIALSSSNADRSM